MALFDLKPVGLKIVFIAVFAFFMGTIIIPNIVKGSKNGSLPLLILLIFLYSFAIISSAILSGGVSLIFYEIFIRNKFKVSLDLFAGAFSLAAFIFILFKFPGDFPRICAVFIMPVTNLLLAMKFSAWLCIEQTLSIPLALVYACIIFFINFNSFFGFLNRFSYWEGEDAASFGVLLIFVMPIAVVFLLIYIIYVNRKNRKSNESQLVDKT